MTNGGAPWFQALGPPPRGSVPVGSGPWRTRPRSRACYTGGRLGTRLRPLTVYTPKPMLPVAGVPFLAHQLARPRDAGVGHVVLATSYRAEVFEGYLGDGAAWAGARVRDRGRAARHRRRHPQRRAAALVAARTTRSSSSTATSSPATTSAPGAPRTATPTPTSRCTWSGSPTRARTAACRPTPPAASPQFLEKTPDPVTDQVNAGCYVFRRRVVDAIPADRVVSVERETFPGLLAAGALVLGCVDDAYWLDLGTPAGVRHAAPRDLVRGVLRSSAVPGPPGESLVLAGAVVARRATVDGGTVVGAGARVAPVPWCAARCCRTASTSGRTRASSTPLSGQAPGSGRGPPSSRRSSATTRWSGADCEITAGHAGLGRRHAAGPVGAVAATTTDD